MLLVDAIAETIDRWRKDHPDLMVSEILAALEEIRFKLTEGIIREAPSNDLQ